MTEPHDPHSVVNFSQAQTGDVRMGDVVGGDKITNYYGSSPPAASATPAFQVPYPSNPLFRGRDDALAALAQVLVEGDAGGTAAVLPTVSGTGGIGKTQLATEFAHKYRDAFPGGVFWLNMEQADHVANQVAACAGPGGLELPGWEAMGFDDRIAAVRRAWTAPVRRLIVFDNLEEPGLLAKWRPAGGGARVLITTRRGQWARSSGVKAVPLQTLARAESVRLLLAPRWGDQIEAALADPVTAPEADAIAEDLGDLPLALTLAGAYLESYPSLSLAGYRGKLAEALLSHPSLEAEEGLPTSHISSVAATIRLSYERLDPAAPLDTLALMILQRSALLAPAPIPHRLLVRLTERDPDNEAQALEVDGALGRLVATGLIELLPDGNAILHRLIAAFARTHAPDIAVDMTRVRDGLCREVDDIIETGYALRGQAYLPHLEATVQHKAPEDQAGDDDLLTSLATLLGQQGNIADARTFHLRALTIRERVFGSSDPITAGSLYNLASCFFDQGDIAGARRLYERALVIFQQTSDLNQINIARTQQRLARLYMKQRDWANARELYERALDICEQACGPNHRDTAQSLHNLALLLYEQGDPAGARLLYERALSIFEQVLGSTHPHTATCINNLSFILRDQGDLAGARALLERALMIREQVLGPMHTDIATSLNNLANLLRDQGDIAEARLLYERALTIREQVLGPFHPNTFQVRENLDNLDRKEHGEAQ